MYIMLKSKTLKIRCQILLNLASNTTLNAKVNEVKNEVPSITNFATKSSLNAKTNGVKGEIPCITNLATTAAFITVENEIPSFSDLVKKNRLWCKYIRNGKKYFSPSYYNK